MRPTTAPRGLVSAVREIEQSEALDPAAARLVEVTAPLAESRAGALLRGEWLGHALHPLLTDFPLGCWIGAGLLDLFGGRKSRAAAQRLVGAGLLFVPVTAAAGAVDARTAGDARSRRVAVVHGGGNVVVALAYYGSWRARRRGHHVIGLALGFTAATLAWGTGYLGGHLSLGRGVGQGTRGFVDAGERGDERGETLADDALVDLDGAAQVEALVAGGVLVPASFGDGSTPRFRVAEVRAARLVGG